MIEANEYDVIRNQFFGLQQLDKDIEIINIINDYNATLRYIGTNTDHFKFSNYKELFDKTLREESFTISLLDDSMLALYYEFDGMGKIVKHNLSFIPNYRMDLFRDEDWQYEGDDPDVSEELLSKRLSNYLRIDYDGTGYAEYYHSMVHMHVGVFSESIRMPFQTIVYPYEFLYLVFKYIYHLDDKCLKCLDCEYVKHVKLSNNELKKFSVIYGANGLGD